MRFPKTGEIRRLSMAQDANGNAGAEVWTIIFSTHNIDLQPIPENKRVSIAGGQQKYESTHKIFPDTKTPINACIEGDFYLVDSKNYKIIEKHVFERVAYVNVLEGSFGIVE